MPSWSTCFSNVVIGRVNRRWQRSPLTWDDDLGIEALRTIEGATTPGAALVYSYAYLNHHVGAASESFKLGDSEIPAFSECVLIDYGCGPGTALMALAETQWLRNGVGVRSHYVGLDTPSCQSIPIAQEMASCIRDQGLIKPESTADFVGFGASFQLPLVPVECPVFFALCYVLAHPYYDLPLQIPGRSTRADPVEQIAAEIMRYREVYQRPIHLVYTNAKYHPNRPVHAAWARLMTRLGLRRNVRSIPYQYLVYSSNRINGTGIIADWRNAQFRYAAPGSPKHAEAHCDFQTFA